MSGGQRIGLLVVALGVLALAFFGLAPDDKQDETASTTTTAPAPAPVTSTATTTAAPVSKPKPKPRFTVIDVRGGKPVGGVRTIKLTSGERARIEVRSPDTSDEVHLHGYDIKRDLKAGGRVRFVFKTDAEGIFELELEGAHAQIAKLEVQPG